MTASVTFVAAMPPAPPVAPRRRADRLDLLARLLRDRPGVTAGELARELGVSARSVFRDLDALRERGLPVESARGRGGGLRLRGDWGLGRVLLAREEALCALLGLALAERLGVPLFAAELARARRKIADAFPTAERRRIAPLRERLLVGAPASAAVRASYGEPAPAVMRRLQAAFVDERLVRAEYAKAGGERSRRLLEPHALVINWPAWYLVAHDRERGAPRTFRVDRFVAVDVEGERFRPWPRERLRELLDVAGVTFDRV